MKRRFFVIKNLGFLLEKIMFKVQTNGSCTKLEKKKTHLQLNIFIDLVDPTKSIVLNFFCAVGMFFFS